MIIVDYKVIITEMVDSVKKNLPQLCSELLFLKSYAKLPKWSLFASMQSKLIETLGNSSAPLLEEQIKTAAMEELVRVYNEQRCLKKRIP